MRELMQQRLVGATTQVTGNRADDGAGAGVDAAVVGAAEARSANRPRRRALGQHPKAP
jgi:hypothetical protein